MGPGGWGGCGVIQAKTPPEIRDPDQGEYVPTDKETKSEEIKSEA